MRYRRSTESPRELRALQAAPCAVEARNNMGMRFASFVFVGLTLAAQNLTLDKDSALGKQLAEEVHRSTKPIESQEQIREEK